MVPQVHPVFAETRLVYRMIKVEAGMEELDRLLPPLQELCDRVPLEAIVTEQREVIEEMAEWIDHHTEIINRIAVRQSQQRSHQARMWKLAARRSLAIEKKHRKYDKILNDLTERLEKLKI